MIPLDGIKDEEFGFRTKVGRVTDAGRLQIGFGTAGERARVAVVALTGRRLKHVAVEHERVGFAEGVHTGGVGVRLQEHVGRFNAAPADEGRAVERLAEFKRVLVELVGRNRQVHFLAEQIGDAKVHELAVVVLNHLQHISSGRHTSSPKSIVRPVGSCGPRQKRNRERDFGGWAPRIHPRSGPPNLFVFSNKQKACQNGFS